MKRFCFIVLGLLFTLPALAGRVLPQNMDMAVLKSAQYPQVELTEDGFSWLKLLTIGWLDGAKQFQMTPTVRIRSQQNLFVTYNNLPKFAGKAVAVRRNNKNQIEEIWILTEAEREVYRQRAEAKRK